MYGLESLDGLNQLMTARFLGVWRAIRRLDYGQMVDGKQPYREKFVLQENYAYMPHAWEHHTRVAKTRDCFRPARPMAIEQSVRLDLLSLYGVRYLISPVELISGRLNLLPSTIRDPLEAMRCDDAWVRFKRQLGGDYVGIPLYIYENPDSLPRAFLAQRIEILPSQRAVLDRMSALTANELRDRALLAAPDVGPAEIEQLRAMATNSGSLEISHYGGDTLRFDVHSENSGIVVVSNHHLNGWRASVNSRQVKILPVYHALQGIVVPPGDSEVELIFKSAAQTVWQ